MLIATVVAALMTWSRPVLLSINGERVTADVPPVTQPREAFVPLRTLADSLGAETTYDQKSGLIEVIVAGNTLRLRVGDRTATLNGNPIRLHHAPFTVRGRVMVTLNVIERAFGSKVRYDALRERIEVVSPGRHVKR